MNWGVMMAGIEILGVALATFFVVIGVAWCVCGLMDWRL
jgi:hypothetical protein